MSTPVSGAVSWTTPVTINSGDVVAAADLNALNKDVAFLRAKPYTLVVQTGQPTVGVNPANLPTSTDLSAANGKVLFATANGGTIATSASTSAVGSISVLSDGRFSTPSTLAGLYRFSCQMMVNAASNGHARVSAILYDSSGTQIGSIPGNWADSGTTHNAVSEVTFVLPMNVAGSYFGNVSSVKFIGQCVGTTLTLNVGDLNGNGPSSTPPQYNTTASVEYVGTSTGAY
jgi:hypothetical protein